MARRVPVLRQDDVLEGLGDPVDERDDLVALVTARLPPGSEAVLHVDDDQHGVRAGLDLALRERGGTSEASDRLPAAARNERRDSSCMAQLLATTPLTCPQLMLRTARRKRQIRYDAIKAAIGGVRRRNDSASDQAVRGVQLHRGPRRPGRPSASSARRKAGEKKPQLFHRTFQTPKRRDELLDGGSLYWVIKGLVQVRQPLLDLTEGTKEDGTPCCLLILKNELVAGAADAAARLPGLALSRRRRGARGSASAALPEASSPCRPSCRKQLAELGLL